MPNSRKRVEIVNTDGPSHDCSSWRTKMERQMEENTKICRMNQKKMVENTKICLQTQGDVQRAHECLDMAQKKIDEISNIVDIMAKKVGQTQEGVDTLNHNLSGAVWIAQHSRIAKMKAIILATFVKDGVLSLSALAAALVPVIALTIAVYELWVWYKTGVMPHIPLS